MATEAARNLVVYLQRAEGQQRYGSHLAAQRAKDGTVLDLLAHIADHPAPT